MGCDDGDSKLAALHRKATGGTGTDWQSGLSSLGTYPPYESMSWPVCYLVCVRANILIGALVGAWEGRRIPLGEMDRGHLAMILDPQAHRLPGYQVGWLGPFPLPNIISNERDGGAGNLGQAY